MQRPDITLSWPDHPAMAEMVASLKNDVNYEIVGARFRQGARGSMHPSLLMRGVHRAAMEIRRYSAGAIAYQRARAALMLRSASEERPLHCCSHLLYGDHPWIGDYENVNVLGFYSPRLLQSRQFVEHLRRTLAAPTCRGIRVWSESGRQSFHALFSDEAIRKKLRVIPPSLETPKAVGIGRREGPAIPRILFVAKGFWVKGGSLFLRAIAKLRQHEDFRVDFVCDLPPEMEYYRREIGDIVSFYEPGFSREELFTRFYKTADIFVMLGMADSYGLALLEASAFGLPIVAMRLDSGLSDLLAMTGNAIQVEPAHQIFDSNGVHCLDADELIRRIQTDEQIKVVDQIAEAIGGLIGHHERRSEMGARGRKAVSHGSLSPSAMRHSMLELYRSTMN